MVPTLRLQRAQSFGDGRLSDADGPVEKYAVDHSSRLSHRMVRLGFRIDTALARSALDGLGPDLSRWPSLVVEQNSTLSRRGGISDGLSSEFARCDEAKIDDTRDTTHRK